MLKDGNLKVNSINEEGDTSLSVGFPLITNLDILLMDFVFLISDYVSISDVIICASVFCS